MQFITVINRISKSLFQAGLLLVLFLTQNAFGQEQPKRAPVFGKLILAQRIISAPEFKLSKEDIDIKTYASHSFGLGFGVDYVLNPPGPNQNPVWQLNSAFYVFSAPLKYDATLPAERHGFDRDISFSFLRRTSGIEATIGLSRSHTISEFWRLKLGIGLNLQDIFIRDNLLRATAIVVIDSNVTSTTIFSGNNGFRFNPRSEQDLHFNTVVTLGLSRSLTYSRQLNLDLRFCRSKQRIIEPLAFNFGEPGEIHYNKSFLALDISYVFSLNRSISFKL